MISDAIGSRVCAPGREKVEAKQRKKLRSMEPLTGQVLVPAPASVVPAGTLCSSNFAERCDDPVTATLLVGNELARERPARSTDANARHQHRHPCGEPWEQPANQDVAQVQRRGSSAAMSTRMASSKGTAAPAGGPRAGSCSRSTSSFGRSVTRGSCNEKARSASFVRTGTKRWRIGEAILPV